MCQTSELIGQQVVVRNQKMQFYLEGTLLKWDSPGTPTYCVEASDSNHVVFKPGEIAYTTNAGHPVITLH